MTTTGSSRPGFSTGRPPEGPNRRTSWSYRSGMPRIGIPAIRPSIRKSPTSGISAPLNLPPGSVVTFHAEALDIDTLKSAQPGQES